MFKKKKSLETILWVSDDSPPEQQRAYEASVAEGRMKRERKERRNKLISQLWVIIVGIAAILAAVFAILQYFKN